MVYIVMGVSGSGKTTVGRLLAESLGLAFYDADAFHPQGNMDKMARGIPLDDEDRSPWLADVAARLAGWHSAGGCVLACSALKESYRRQLVAAVAGDLIFIYLCADRALLAERLAKRHGHFFPAALLASQLETLEEPAQAIRVGIDASPAAICARIRLALNEKAGPCAEGQRS